MMDWGCHPNDSNQPVEIHELVAQGVRNVQEMKRHLKIHVETNLFPDPQARPAPTNVGMYPLDQMVWNHIFSALMKLQ